MKEKNQIQSIVIKLRDEMNRAKELNKINIQGEIVIGEGELDEAPMLYIGERLGTLNGPKFDIAVDPLEGTKFTANGQPNAFSVLAVSEKGCLLSAPDTYMEKIVIGLLILVVISMIIYVQYKANTNIEQFYEENDENNLVEIKRPNSRSFCYIELSK